MKALLVVLTASVLTGCAWLPADKTREDRYAEFHDWFINGVKK